jgi:hypothetical protein
MRILFALFIFSALLQTGPLYAQRDIPRVESNNAEISKLEGVTLKNGRSTMLVISNATVKKSIPESTAGSNRLLAPTFLQKLGQFEVHKQTSPTVLVEASTEPKQPFSVNGKPVPRFALTNVSKDYVGTAYLSDTKRIGLISNEISVKFNTGSVPSQYAGLVPIELVKGSGLYIFKASDIYSWLKLVANFQLDPQVALVEPRIVTEFDQTQ